MSPPTLMLLDNGSRRPAACLALRRLAASFGERIGREVHPVSLQHADRIRLERLDGRAARTFEAFLKQRLAQGERNFLAVPLFFGAGKAVTGLIPDTVSQLQVELGDFTLRQSEVLCPLPRGEPRLIEILHDQLLRATAPGMPTRVVLVDHGSPSPRVTAVRKYLAGGLRERLGPHVTLAESVMERRDGPEYDFNGPLLEQTLERMGRSDNGDPIALSLLFLAPGRHAGPGGDIEYICRRAQDACPGLRVLTSPLVGEHPALLDILETRLHAAL